MDKSLVYRKQPISIDQMLRYRDNDHNVAGDPDFHSVPYDRRFATEALAHESREQRWDEDRSLGRREGDGHYTGLDPTREIPHEGYYGSERFYAEGGNRSEVSDRYYDNFLKGLGFHND